MSHWQECKIAALATELGHSGKLNSLEYEFLVTQVPDQGSLNGNWIQFCQNNGATSGKYNEAMIEYYLAQGAVGEGLSELQADYWCNVASGGIGKNFCVVQMFHPVGDDFVQVQLTEIPDTVDATGWSAKVNETPVPIVFITVSGRLVKFNIGTTQTGDAVSLSYDGAGNTIYDGTQLCTFTDMKASNTIDGEYQWAAAGSIYMLTDGASNATDADHEAHYQALGYGSKNPVTPDGLALPSFEGIFYQSKANSPPWYGGRVAENHLLNSATPVTQNITA
ncbi:MAG: hypothetical protein DRP45_12175, partial [Candidatus Zixiibacteriota bacterium]